MSEFRINSTTVLLNFSVFHSCLKNYLNARKRSLCITSLLLVLQLNDIMKHVFSLIFVRIVGYLWQFICIYFSSLMLQCTDLYYYNICLYCNHYLFCLDTLYIIRLRIECKFTSISDGGVGIVMFTFSGVDRNIQKGDLNIS